MTKGVQFPVLSGVHSTAPKPSENRHKNPQRESELSFEEAVARYEPLYPETYVRGSETNEPF